MKLCPFCQVENRDDAQLCRFCGRDMNPPPVAWDALPQEDSPEPTQPVRPAGSRGAGSSGPTLPPTPPPGGWVEPDIDQTQPPYPAGGAGQKPPGSYPGTGYDMRPTGPTGGYPNNWPAQGAYPAQSGTQPLPPAQPTGAWNPPASSVGAGPYRQPAYGAPPPYPPAGAQIYAQPAAPARSSDRRWMVLLGVLLLMLVCTGSAAVWLFTSTAANGVDRAGADLATQVAGLFSGVPSSNQTPFPSATLLAPSPWPTFTPEPSQTLAPTSTPEVTQPAGLERYLTVECSAALDHLEGLSKAVTENPSLPLDGAWREELSQSVKTVREQCGTLDQASPVPGLMAEAQQNLDQATQEFDEANRLFKEGVEKLDPGKVVEAGQHFGEATRYLNQALESLRKIGN